MERKRLELSTSALRTQKLSIVSGNSKGLASTLFGACTTACTRFQETGHADPLVKLATELAGLSQADRQRLADMLTSQQTEQKGAGQ